MWQVVDMFEHSCRFGQNVRWYSSRFQLLLTCVIVVAWSSWHSTIILVRLHLYISHSVHQKFIKYQTSQCYQSQHSSQPRFYSHQTTHYQQTQSKQYWNVSNYGNHGMKTKCTILKITRYYSSIICCSLDPSYTMRFKQKQYASKGSIVNSVDWVDVL